MKYGWTKDRFRVSETYHIPKVIKLPPSSGLSPFLPAVFNQDGVGCCTGCGISGMSSVVAAKVGVEQSNQKLLYSVNWIYNWGRRIEGDLQLDNGAQPGDCLDALCQNGYVYEKDWPFLDKLDTTDPMAKDSLAFHYPNFQSVRVDAGLDGILSALGEGHPIALGAWWFTAWEDPGPDGILKEVTANDPVAGGHETFLYDYDLDKQLLLGQNSWGNWAKGGRYLMPFSAINVFKSSGGYDAHYVDFTPSPTPTPPPAPTPSTCKVGNGIAKTLNVYSTLAHRKGRFYYLNKGG